MNAIWAIVLALVVGAPPEGGATGAPVSQPAPHPITARLVGETATVAPGGTVWLAVVLDIEPEWHTYWPGENDTGAPIRMKWTVPSGWTVGEVLWPAPRRYIAEGDLLDHVLEGRSVLLVPLTAPAHPGTDDAAGVQLDIGWLVCKSACIPGGATLQTTLRVKAGGPEPAESSARDAALFAEARGRLPEPSAGVSGLSTTWIAQGLQVRVEGASALAFSVGLGSMRIADPIRHGQSEGNTLTLPVDFADAERGFLRGVLEVRRGRGVGPMYVALNVPRPEAGSAKR